LDHADAAAPLDYAAMCGSEAAIRAECLALGRFLVGNWPSDGLIVEL
jgi:hypothetical protein